VFLDLDKEFRIEADISNYATRGVKTLDLTVEYVQLEAYI